MQLDARDRGTDESARHAPVPTMTAGREASAWLRRQAWDAENDVASLERAFRVGAQIETGTFFMNRCDSLDPLLPWTGVKDTGKGMTLSKYGFLGVTRRKSFHLRTQT